MYEKSHFKDIPQTIRDSGLNSQHTIHLLCPGSTALRILLWQTHSGCPQLPLNPFFLIKKHNINSHGVNL